MKRTIATTATLIAVLGTSSFVIVESTAEKPVAASDSQSDREEDHSTSRSYTRPSLDIEDMADMKRDNSRALLEKETREKLAAEKKRAEQEAAKKAALAAAVEKARKQREQNSKPRTYKTATPRPVVNSSPKQYALSRLGSTQYNCFNNIVIKESGWNYTATNPSSGAYGLVQALPGYKMASAGADWKTNPITQINWGISYMNDRYGSPCGAWSFWLNNHWY